MEMELEATLYSARVDKEGAWKVTFDVPLSEGVNVAKLSAFTESNLKLKILVLENAAV